MGCAAAGPGAGGTLGCAADPTLTEIPSFCFGRTKILPVTSFTAVFKRFSLLAVKMHYSLNSPCHCLKIIGVTFLSLQQPFMYG